MRVQSIFLYFPIYQTRCSRGCHNKRFVIISITYKVRMNFATPSSSNSQSQAENETDIIFSSSSYISILNMFFSHNDRFKKICLIKWGYSNWGIAELQISQCLPVQHMIEEIWIGSIFGYLVGRSVGRSVDRSVATLGRYQCYSGL